MKKITLNTVKDCNSVFSSGQNVIIGGRNLWIFRVDGSFVGKYKTVRNPSKVAFLPDNTVLVDGHGDGAYHYISLGTGEILWSTLKKGRRTRTSYRFAVSPDGSIIYDVCYVGYNELCIDRIVPKEQLHDRYIIKDGLRVTNDIYCNEHGALCILQSHILIDAQNHLSRNSQPIKKYGILEVSIDQGKMEYYWGRQWQDVPDPFTSVRGCDGRKILCEDFSVLDLKTMQIYSLLSAADLQSLPKDNFGWYYNQERNLLMVYYIAQKLNIVIDCAKRKVVARYARDDWSVGYQGCLIGNEFWTGTSNGIIKRPFPTQE